MTCYVPFIWELTSASRRLLRIAEILGANCRTLSLTRESADPIREIENNVAEEEACLAISATVAREWLGTTSFPSPLASYLTQRFKFLLIYELGSDPVSCDMLVQLTQGAVSGVVRTGEIASGYQIAGDEVAGAFGGLKTGPTNANDNVFLANEGRLLVKPIVSTGGRPLFARIDMPRAQLFLLSAVTSSHLDLEGDLDGHPVSAFFPEMLPVAMFLRHACKDECWHPAGRLSATLVLDDPPLWKKYGFVEFEKVLAFMDQFQFHTTVAFIPYYWRRYSSSTIRLFRQRPDRFSICFHGNDHTYAELAAEDPGAIQYLLNTAQARMRGFASRTGIPCGAVMVFPHGAFSRGALVALKDQGFVGAVNWGHMPSGERPPLTLENVLQPSVQYNGGCPLFLRRLVKESRPEDIAMDAFVGRPVLLRGHHDLFSDPTALFETVSMINRVVPEVVWRDLQSSLERACLVRKSVDGSLVIRPYAMALSMENSGTAPIRCVVDWIDWDGNTDSKKDAHRSDLGHTESGCTNANRHTFTLDPGNLISLNWPRKARTPQSLIPSPTFARIMKTWIRRSLTEFRDNYLIRSPAAMWAAQRLRNAFFQ